MHRTGTLAGLFLLLPAVGAQDFAKMNDAFVDAKIQYLDQQKKLTSSEEYKDLRAKKDMKGLRALYAKLVSPNKAFAAKFKKAWQAAQGSDAELQWLTWLLKNDYDRTARKDYLKAMVDRFADSEEMIPFVRYVSFTLTGADGKAALEKLMKSNNAQVRLWTEFTRLQGIQRDRSADADAKAEAGEAIQKLAKEHPDSIPALMANAKDFVAKRLQIGMEAPDIAGTDLDGNSFKLSDYRGKVVVVDFWGDW